MSTRRRYAVTLTFVCRLARPVAGPIAPATWLSYRDRVATYHYATLLDRLVRQGRRTIEETCAAYEDAARQMGERATLSSRTLIRWMKGEVGTPRPVAQRVAEHFWGHSFEVLLGPADVIDDDGRQPVAVRACADLRSKSPGGATPHDQVYYRHTALHKDEAGGPTDRRHAMQAFGAAAIGAGLGTLLSQAATDAMESTRRAEASDVGPHTLEHLELAVAGMASAFAYSPPGEMFHMAQAYRQRVAWFIEGKQTLRQRRELYRQAGWLSIILGWLSHDLGDPLAAEAHCLDAWEHGWQANDGEICGWAMDTAATIAMYNNRPGQARDSAARGLAHAPSGSAAAVRLACQLTRAYGRLGERDRFDEALATTCHKFDQLPARGSGLFSADAGRIASYAATSSIWLGRPDDAVRYASEALDFYATVDPAERSPTREAISRLDLGLALIAMKTPDGAAEEALAALSSERITGAVLTRASEVDVALQRWYPRLAATREVHERFLSLSQQQNGRPQLTA